MKTLLNTIPIDQELMYLRQGYAGNHVTGSPIADGARLLPFESMPFEYISGSKALAYLVSICGNYTMKLGFLDSRITGTKVTFYRDLADSGLTIPSGYYYIETSNTEYKFKTEVFFVPTQTDELKGSFNDSFNASYDT